MNGKKRKFRRPELGVMKKLELNHLGIRPINAIYGPLQVPYFPLSDRPAMDW
jgi:hypothetical protein